MAKKTPSFAPDVIALAKKILRAKADSCEELDQREFWDDSDAHDRALVEKTYLDFRAKMNACQAALAKEFGEPSETGDDEHDAIPRNGILRHAIWQMNGKSLFLAISHEEQELPCLLLLGVTRNT